MKIKCMCCHRTAEVVGKHEFRKLEGCRNGTFIETGRSEKNPKIGGTRLDLIRIWDAEAKSYISLVA